MRERRCGVYSPTAAEVEHRWHLWRRRGSGDLERRPARSAEVVDIADDPRTGRVEVFDTPAWSVALQRRPATDIAQGDAHMMCLPGHGGWRHSKARLAW